MPIPYVRDASWGCYLHDANTAVTSRIKNGRSVVIELSEATKLSRLVASYSYEIVSLNSGQSQRPDECAHLSRSRIGSGN